MKIITPGYDNTVVRFECTWCKCVFEAERKEYDYEVDIRNEAYYTAECPCCGKKVYKNAQ